jgi:hypothetical protein
MARASYAVRLYEPDLAGACERFIQRTWPRSDNDARGVGHHTADAPPRVLFLKEGEVIGHVATAPVRLAVQGRLLDAAWAVGLAVVPEHRNGPIAPLLVRKLNEVLDIGLSLHVEDAALRVFKGVGWHHLGAIPQYIRILNPRAFVRTFARRDGFVPRQWARLWALGTRAPWAATAVVRTAFAAHAAQGAMRRRCLAGAVVGEEHRFDSSYTELAERLKERLAVWVYRDEAYLTERYGRRVGAYRLLACRTARHLLGYAVVKLRRFTDDPRMGDLRMGTLVDLAFDPGRGDVLDHLLDATVACCRQERADVVFCSASLDAIGRHLWRHGFVAMPGTLNAAYHDRTGVLSSAPRLQSWHLMRGDSDADANC